MRTRVSRSAGWLAAVVAIAAGLIVPTVGAAHAGLIRSDPPADQVIPTSPGSVTLTFSEPVETALSSIRVFDGAARRVDAGTTSRATANSVATKIFGTLARGTYTVSWRIASADGHPIDGAFVFHVGAPGAQPEGVAGQVVQRTPTAVARATDVARFLNVALIVALIGAIVVTLAIFARTDHEVERRLWYVVAGIGFTSSIVAAATIVLHAASIAGNGLGQAANGTALSAVLGTRFGHVRIAQLGLAELIAIAAVWAPSPGGARWIKRTIGVLAAGLAVTPGLSGHAGAKGALAVVADTGHVLAASVWVGGLAAIMVGLHLAGERRVELAGVVFPRFSAVALWSVGVLVVAGAIGGLIQLDRFEDLWSTTYGRLLLAKIALALTLVGFGARNRRWVGALPDAAQRTGPLDKLRRTVVVELVLMAVAIGVTSVLISKPPATASAVARTSAVAASGQIADLGVRLVVDPGTVGANRVDVYLTRGATPVTVDEVTVSARTASGDVGPFVLIAKQAEKGHYVAPALQVTFAGVWTFDVGVRRGAFDLASTVLTVPLRPNR